MRTDGLTSAFRLPALRRRHREGPIVLLYHRIARTTSDPQLLSVSPKHLAEHLQLIVERYRPVPLSALVEAAREGRLLPRAVAVTFDDGYADNLLAAKPLLEEKGVPATVFVASSHVRDGRSFWWDELERLLLTPGRLPSTLSLVIGDETEPYELGDDAVYTARDAVERAGWTVLDDRDPGPRQRLYRAVCDRFRGVADTERAEALERLRAVAELDRPPAEEPPRPLTLDELGRLAETGLVEIGAHTETHPVLSRLAPERQREEVVGSKRLLEEALGRRVSAFAYPYGAHSDFDETTVSVVRGAGFDHACSTIPGRVERGTNPFRVPRLVVRDWSGPELDRQLAAVGP